MRLRRLLVPLALAAVALTACGGDEDPVADIVLDGSTRRPDRAGVVEAVSVESITVDGDRFELSRNLLSFSTYTLTALPVRATEGSYVHVGVEDGKAVWVAQVAKPLRRPGAAGAFYDGTVRRVDGRTVEFDDGTLLTVADGVALPIGGARVLAEIDVTRDLIVSFGGA